MPSFTRPGSSVIDYNAVTGDSVTTAAQKQDIALNDLYTNIVDATTAAKGIVQLGTTATTAALGNHLHTGVYQPAGSYATSGANSDITSLSGLTTPLSVAQGGTSGATPAAARAALGLGDAALLDVGTAAGTVCAGDDSRLKKPRRNRILNGVFRINQRGYTSGTALAQGVPSTGVGYGHDGWRAGADGCTYTFTQSPAPVQITITAGTLITKTERASIDSTSMVLSWEGTAQARVGVNNAEPSGAYAASPILVTPVAGESVAVEFGTGTVGKVQLENGSTPSEFDWRSAGETLIECQRYLPAWASHSAASALGIGHVFNTTTTIVVLPYPAQPRFVPTGLIVSSAAHLTVALGAATGAATAAIFGSASSRNALELQVSTTAGSPTIAAGQSARVYFNTTSGLILAVGAEL